MQWSDFGPYVYPSVIGCPEPVMTHHARLAAIDFCRKTLCWSKRLDAVVTTGSEEVEIEPDTDAQIVKTKTVLVDGREWPLVTADLGIGLIASQSHQEFCFTENNRVLNVYPIQKAGVPVVVRAAMAPTLSSKSLNNELNEFVEDIAHGVVARIMRLPTFSNPEHAIHESMFRNRIKAIAAKVSRGLLAAKTHSHHTQF